MSQQELNGLEPWIVVDPHFMREWLLPQPLRYYLVEKEVRQWFVWDRCTNLAIAETASNSRPEAVRKFYRWCNREIPANEPITRAMVGVSHAQEVE